ncbi:MAG: C4-dicarboxylate transporter DctA [Bdellovibrionales bacterium]|nr:C4-dicarboxylate transporter DctA [Oligoflexia bacterium]
MKRIHHYLYFWVLISILAGTLVGWGAPEFAQTLKPLADIFIGLIKMLIAPIIFFAVALGISGSGNLKQVGRVGLKAILYFEVVSTFALALGFGVAHLFKPGASFHVDPSTLDASAVAEYASKAHEGGIKELLLGLIPKTFFAPLSGSGEILQVLLVAALFGFAVHGLPEKSRSWVNEGLLILQKVFFRIIAMVMWLAPLGAFASMAFTIGKYGVNSLAPLIYLIGTFYLTCGLFVALVLGTIAKICGFSLIRFLRYIFPEILLVLGTSSSESALAPLMEKLENAGCAKSVVGLVVPTGYSFNLDGTNIYLTLACLFIAQALGISLSFSQELSLLVVAMISSKGASGVTGAGFITLAATLAVVPDVPVAGLTLILGVDRFMSEARAITNMIGNGVATLAIAKWEGALDEKQLHQKLSLNEEITL